MINSGNKTGCLQSTHGLRVGNIHNQSPRGIEQFDAQRGGVMRGHREGSAEKVGGEQHPVTLRDAPRYQGLVCLARFTSSQKKPTSVSAVMQPEAPFTRQKTLHEKFFFAKHAKPLDFFCFVTIFVTHFSLLALRITVKSGAVSFVA